MNDQPPPQLRDHKLSPGYTHVRDRSSARSRCLIAWLAALAALFVAGGFGWHSQSRKDASRKAQIAQVASEPVGVAVAARRNLRVVFDGLGTVTPLVTVTVKTQINGQLLQVAFREGQRLHKGDYLAQVDPRPYQAELDQYEGQLAHDQAVLKQAQVDSARYQTLVRQNSLSHQTADDQVYLVQQDQGSIRADQAQIEAQRLNISYCRIVSPTDGRIGLRTVDPGNYVQVSDSTGLAVVTKITPISVVFSLPEDDLPQVLKPFHDGAKLAVTAFDRANTANLATGELSTIDNEVDTTTGTWKLRALFANTNEMLFPSQFVNIRLLVNILHDVLTVPDAAVLRGAPGTYVYLVKPDDTVIVQKIQVGTADGGLVQVVSGLNAGDRVVVEGSDRLSDGAHVRIGLNSGPPVPSP